MLFSEKRKFGLIAISVFLVGAVTCAVQNTYSQEESQPQNIDAGKYAKLPETARGPQIPAKGYLVREINNGLYWLTNGVYQTMFVVYDWGVVAVDAPPIIGADYLKAISEVTDKPVTHVIYSHYHKDHIGAAADIFPKTAKIIAHKDTTVYLRKANDPKRPLPSIEFDKTYTLKVGSQKILLGYKGANHEPGNIFIYAPQQKVLMLVDVIYPGWIPIPPLSMADDVQGYIDAHDQILAYEFNTFIGGHLNRLGTRQDVETAKEWVLDLMANARLALETVKFSDIQQKVKTDNSWELYKAYFDAVEDECERLMLLKWKGRLGGDDVWTREHVFIMVQYLRSTS